MWPILRALSLPFKFVPNLLFRFAWRLLDNFDGRVGAGLRYLAVASRLKACGQRVYIAPFVFIDHPEKTTLGDDVSIHHFVTILSAGGVYIGDSVAIAHGCSLISGNHTWQDRGTPIKYNKVDLRPVRILDDVWIGSGSRVLAGAIIRERSVVAAGAVVSGEIGPNAIYAGVPAKMVRKL